ncbi:MAG TPA: response regulator, partial [Bacillota bacterium]|nr:response regulator [Bacillota bacterium]
ERCILYVEDDANDVFLLRTAFEDAGIADPILVVSDGQQAIDYLRGVGNYSDRSQYPLPILVLLDLKLPRQSGLQVLAWIRAQPALKGLVVIMFTSSHQPMDLEQAYDLGVNSFIVKPVGLQERLELAQFFKGWWLRFNMFAPSFGTSMGSELPRARSTSAPE